MRNGSNYFSSVHYKLGCFKRKNLQQDLQEETESSPATEVKTEQLSEEKFLIDDDNSKLPTDKDGEQGLH